jgi:putative flippase GtrA
VFRTHGRWLREFGVFASYYLFNYAANWAALPLLVDVAGAPLIPAQLGITLVLIVGSWFWHSRVTFRA